MLTSDDLSQIVNWSSDHDVYSGSSWNSGNTNCGDNNEDEKENTEQNF